MSQAPIETLRALYEAFNRRDWDNVLRTVSPDFELITPDRDPLAGAYRGQQEIRRIAEEQVEAFEEVVAEPQEFFERGDQIVVFLLLRLRPIGSSATLELRIAHVWTMRDGRAARCKIFPEREQALESVGMREDGTQV